MDRIERRTLALAAARKLAFAAALGGCGNVILVEEAPPVDDPVDDPVPAATEDPVEGAPPALPVPQVPAVLDCPAYVAANLPLDGTAPPDDPALAGCCDQVLDQASWSATPEGPLTQDLLWGCCSVTGFDWESHPFCTPWGPPVPPRLTRALRALLAREASS